MADAGRNSSGNARIALKAHLLGSEGTADLPKLAAYAFTSGGRMLARAPLPQATGDLQFRVGAEAMSVRVLIGPDVEEKEPAPSDLLRRGAVERHVRIDAGRLGAEVHVDVIPDVWRCWLRGLCFVRGTLLKREVRGGITVDLPVCDAEVEIFEVDPIFVFKLPDDVIAGLRRYLIDPLPRRPLPGRQPQPGASGPPSLPTPPRPIPDPPPFIEAPDHLIGPVFPLIRSRSAALRDAVLPAAPESLRAAALRVGDAMFRRELEGNLDFVREYLCLFHPWFVRKDLLRTVRTDECGHFQAILFLGCNNRDKPDLYFRATQRFLWFDVPIYEPLPVRCHTFWDYKCGTEVTLITTSPFARTCRPCPPINAPDNWVLVMAIGNFPLSRIRGTGVTLQATTNADNVGLTDADGPWGGLLRPRIEFDSSLRDTLGVKYYQVSIRKGSAGNFTILTGDVGRHYIHEVNGQPVISPYPLGPQTVNGVANLFEIPPALPPDGQWSLPDIVEDTTSAKFPSAVLAPAADHGKYQIKVELFDVNGAPVDLMAKGIEFVVPTSTDLSGTIDTVEASTLGLLDGNSFVMTLHVDNNHCDPAVIDAPVLAGNAASDECGVLTYTPGGGGSVHFGWTASHPNGIAGNGFATFSFAIYRGVNLLSIPPGSPTLPVSGMAKIGNAAFANDQTVADLLGSCRIAGFSENLYVAATAIDGLRRLSEYDSSAVRAFVLAPPLPNPTP